jgi:hypothetical protein
MGVLKLARNLTALSRGGNMLYRQAGGELRIREDGIHTMVAAATSGGFNVRLSQAWIILDFST